MTASKPSRPLKIALLTYAYAPSIGGLETVSQLICDGLRLRGHTVRVATMTPAASDEPSQHIGADAAAVLRSPSQAELFRLLQWSDAVVQSNVSLRMAWPLALRLIRRPWIVVNHDPVTRESGRTGIRDIIKLASLRAAKLYAVSAYLTRVTRVPARVMPNPYDVTAFHPPAPGEEALRTGELVFLGRIVHAKGLDVLIEALHLLATEGFRPRLSVVGGGSEREPIEQRAIALGLTDQVTWLGVLRGAAVGDVLRRHQVIVVPSRPEPAEALGLVAIEAIACGCVPIASRQGGLPEAVGPCGLLVEPENPQALAAAIRDLLGDPGLRARLREKASEHVGAFHPDAVLDSYESALAEEEFR